MINLNPLDVLGIRELSFLPTHFVKARINDTSRKDIYNWIKNNLTGRFCIVRIPQITNNVVKSELVVAFEDHKELTYFVLACPFFRRT